MLGDVNSRSDSLSSMTHLTATEALSLRAPARIPPTMPPMSKVVDREAACSAVTCARTFHLATLFQPSKTLLETAPYAFAVEPKEDRLLLSICWSLDGLPAFVTKAPSADV